MHLFSDIIYSTRRFAREAAYTFLFSHMIFSTRRLTRVGITILMYISVSYHMIYSCFMPYFSLLRWLLAFYMFSVYSLREIFLYRSRCD